MRSLYDIIKIGHPALREKAKDIEEYNDTLTKIVEDMKVTMAKAKGLGLAGTQVGIVKRVFIYDLGEGTEVVVNPKIVWRSEEKIKDTEGCLSVPDIEVTIERAEKVKMEGCDLKGEKKTIEAEGLMARLFQHEIDHLDGTLIIDRASEDERREATKKLYGND